MSFVSVGAGISSLTFQETSGGSRDIFGIDNVTLALSPSTAVPEPGTWSIMISELGLVGGMMRRRSKVIMRIA